MNRKMLLGLWALLSVSLLPVSSTHAKVDSKKAAKVFKAELQKLEKKGTQVSAKIVNLTNTRTLMSLNPDRPLNPASSVKIITAYVALKRLGINSRFETEVFQNDNDSLCVKGSGDPSFVIEDMVLFVSALKRRGVEDYSGTIILDNSVFDGELYPEGRMDQDSERAYNAPISGLNFNYNTISVFVNPGIKGKSARIGLDFPYDFIEVKGEVKTSTKTDVTWGKETKKEKEIITVSGKIAKGSDEWRKPFRITHPNKGFGQALAQTLELYGVPARGSVKIQEGSCSGDAIYVHKSKSMGAIVQLMNKYSNNFIAESLVKKLDHEVNAHPGTSTGGTKFLSDELQKLGVPMSKKGRVLVSGSGLSRRNRIAADDFVVLLKHIHDEKIYLPEIFASLPIAGIDGTLRKKYLRSRVHERLRGKTGTLNGVRSIVGVYPNKQGEWVAVSITTNGSRGIPENALARYLDTL